MPSLDDAKLCELYDFLYPDVDDNRSGYTTGEPLADLKQATYDEISRRGTRAFQTYADSPAPPPLSTLTEPQLTLLLYGGIRERGEREALRRERIERAVREAITRGGRPSEIVLANYGLRDCSWMSDQQLRDLLPRLRGQSSRWAQRGRNRERVLCEMVRRGRPGSKEGTAWEKVLADELRQLREAAAGAKDVVERFRLTSTLETLTALRRVQGKVDPLRVEVDDPPKVEGVFPSLPQFTVALVNRDEGNQTVPFTQGGDYRSGRQARWRFEVRDAAGGLIAQRKILFGMGGGLFSEGELAPGERWGTTLQMSSFVAALPPGRYTLHVLYHDSVCIADEEGTDGLIVSKSAPIALTIKPLEFPDRAVDARKVRDLLAAMELNQNQKPNQKLKIVAGTYGPWAHKLVPPDSPHGRLLAVGLAAVPPLLEELEDPKLTPARRALVLSLLYSLTGQNDPRDAAGVLAGYDSAEGPWAIWGDGMGGLGLGGSSVAEGGRIDPQAQREFAGRWAPWKQYVKITPSPIVPSAK